MRTQAISGATQHLIKKRLDKHPTIDVDQLGENQSYQGRIKNTYRGMLNQSFKNKTTFYVG